MARYDALEPFSFPSYSFGHDTTPPSHLHGLLRTVITAITCGLGSSYPAPLSGRGCKWRSRSSPRFLGDPSTDMPCSSTPVRPAREANCSELMLFSGVARPSTLTIWKISELYHTACLLAVYASPSGSPRTAQDSLPAVLANLPDGILTR